jgi:hypothetical protein
MATRGLRLPTIRRREAAILFPQALTGGCPVGRAAAVGMRLTSAVEGGIITSTTPADRPVGC